MMRFRTLLAALSPLVFLLSTAPLKAQTNAEKPAVYTYVAQWSVPRAQWGDMAKMQQSNTTILNKLVDDGTLVGYGLYETAVHDAKGPTHGNWFQASSMAGLFKALDALQGSTTSNATLLGSGPHQDILLVSHDYDGHPGSFRNAVLRGLSVTVKPGMSDEFHRAWDQTIRPVLEKLVADGALHAWSYQEEWLVNDPGRITAVLIANGPEGLDRYIAAINDMLHNHPDAVAPLLAATQPGSRRDFLLRVGTMRQK